MTTEVMKQAIEALEMQFKGADAMGWSTAAQKVAITALRQAIEQASLDTLSDLTPKREAFANAVASGMTQADAYRHASLDTSQSHSCTWPSCNPEAGEQEPVAWQAIGGSIWSHKSHEDDRPLYTSPPARAWTGLTEDEAHVCFKSANVWHAIEAKLKEKNHGG